MTSKRTSTARSRLAAMLTEEILASTQTSTFAIASEHQLCRRFSVSRVTVRLALSDLENRGLIYRKHGKGTFAYGQSNRPYRNIGVLLKSTQSAEHRPIAEFVRGLQTIMAPLRSGLLLISTPPEEWRPEMTSSLAGIVVVPEGVTANDMEIIRERKIPYFVLAKSNLEGPHIKVGQRDAARKMTELLLGHGHRCFALLTGLDAAMDLPKRMGVHEALSAAGIDPAVVPEFSAHGHEGEIFEAARSLLKLQPRPTAVVAFDDSLASILSFHARRIEGMEVPADLSIVSFNEWPYLNFIEPNLTTVRFEFFRAGQCAAEALNQAALTGQPLTDLVFEPIYRTGQTVGAVPVAGE